MITKPLKTFSLKDINALVEADYLMKQVDPVSGLEIYNYTQKTQFENVWNDYTLQARGLVLDKDGNVIARPFAKFFNYEQVINAVDKSQLEQNFELFDKMDGSLGLLFWYQGVPIFASRGSFTSDQAVRGKMMLSKYNIDNLPKDYTYVFEIIYPENRIVVDYGDMEELVLLGAIHTSSAEEMSYKDMVDTGLTVVKTYDGLGNFNEIRALNWANSEGFVVRFANGFRMKIKFEDYVRLHRILTNFSSYDIWETMRRGEELSSALSDVPDEFFGWVKATENSIIENYNRVLTAHKAVVLDLEHIKDQKEFAAAVLAERRVGISSKVLFFLRAGKKVEDMIWVMVKPKYELPFKDKE